ncbi:Type II secretory pathway, component PulJ [Sedimentisphaera cyanobacteriorum]|uniref:Type II secretory pathway, component PulJ n=1 Tax=Sedimentisphaera cyanobacteriorum TaxID=1940790 RepID=A0A1Q2HPT7_9BACT|nr:prepilin-type N-terminal cleavage/methylation domain-containing protein [Sedimentisphaera cyanobacteriorum]AQQ09380.1 Type II secretory pathway, component PulJ [Sedimentisphaera cyanobacteriorum]
MRKGLTLLELLAALAVTSIILITMVTLLYASQNTLKTINTELDASTRSQEILQKIAEDINEFAAEGENVTFKLESKNTPEGLLYRFEMTNYFNTTSNQKDVFKKVVWQSDFDVMLGTFVIYRSRSGMQLEDSVVSTEQKQNPEREIYVPVTTGATYFSLQAYDNDKLLDEWKDDDMPGAMFIGVSFDPPVELITGEVVVPEEDRFYRTVSVSRARNYDFKFVEKDLEAEYEELLEEGQEESESEQDSAEQEDVSREDNPEIPASESDRQESESERTESRE